MKKMVFLSLIVCNFMIYAQSWDFNVLDDRDVPIELISPRREYPPYESFNDQKKWRLTPERGNINDPYYPDTWGRCVALWNVKEANKIYLNRSFKLKLTMNFGSRKDYYWNQSRWDDFGGDGIVWLIHQDDDVSTNYIGLNGMYLGYIDQSFGGSSLNSSLAVEFDTYNNAGSVPGDLDDSYTSDPAPNSHRPKISIVKDAYPVFNEDVYTFQNWDELKDGDNKCIVITWHYNPQPPPNTPQCTLKVYYEPDYNPIPVLTRTFNTPNDAISGITLNDPVYWGITSSTGISTNEQTITFEYLNTNCDADVQLVLNKIGTTQQNYPSFNYCSDFEFGNSRYICYQNGTNIELKALPLDEAVGTYSWYTDDGTESVISGASSQTLSIPIPQNTTKYRVKYNNGSCVASDDFTLHIINPIITLDDSYCFKPGQTNTITATSESGEGVKSSDWNIPSSLPSGVTVSVNSGNHDIISIVTSSSANSGNFNLTYNVTFTKVEGNNTTTCTLSKTITIYIENIQVSITKVPDVLCQGENVTLTANVTNGTAPNTFKWIRNQEILSDNDNQVVVNQSGVYQVEVTDNKGCKAEISTTVLLSNFTVEAVVNPVTICEEDIDQVQLNVIYDGNINPPQFQWHWDGGNDNLAFVSPTNIQNPIVKKSGTYELTANDGICTVTVQINVELSDFQITGQTKIEVCNAEYPIQITGININNAEGNVSFLWELPGTPTNQAFANGINNIINPSVLKEGTYILTATDDHCTREFSVKVTNYNQDVKIEVSKPLRLQGKNPEDVLCLGELMAVFTPDPDFNPTSISYLWERHDGPIWTTLSSATARQDIGVSGDYRVTVNAHYGTKSCESTSIKAIESSPFEVTIIKMRDICNGSNTILKAEINDASGIGGTYQYLWLGPVQGNGQELTTNIPGPYRVKVSNTLYPECIRWSDWITVGECNLSIHGYTPSKICIGEEVRLFTSLVQGCQGNLRYEWFELDDQSNELPPSSLKFLGGDFSSPIANPDRNTTYRVYVFNDELFCSDFTDLEVIVTKPNNDFVNGYYRTSSTAPNVDQFSIRCMTKTDDCEYIMGGSSSLNTCGLDGHGIIDFIIRADGEGTILWWKMFGDPSSEIMSIDNIFNFDGVTQGGINYPNAKVHTRSYIATGFYWEYPLIGSGYSDVQIIKINENQDKNSLDNYEYHRFGDIGNLKDDIGYKVIQTQNQSSGNNGFIVIGTTKILKSSNNQDEDLLVIKINPSFGIDWVRAFGGGNTRIGSPDQPNDIVETNDGDFIIVGSSGSNNDFQNPNIYKPQVYILSIDGSGSINWQHTYKIQGAYNNLFGTSIVKAPNSDEAYIVGSRLGYTDAQVTKYDVLLFGVNKNNGNVINSSSLPNKRISSNNVGEINTAVSLTTTPRNDIGVYISSHTDLLIDPYDFDGTIVELKPDISAINKQIMIRTSCTKDVYLTHSRLGPVHELEPIDFTGYAFLYGASCRTVNGIDIENEFLLGRRKLLSDAGGCFNANYFNMTNSNAILIDDTGLKTGTETIITSYNYDDMDEQYSDLNIATEAICESIPICYCDEEKINVDFQPNTTNTVGYCCYSIAFNPTASYQNCTFNKVRISGFESEWTTGSLNFQGVLGPTGATFTNICIPESEFNSNGSYKILIEYLDINDKVICTSERTIRCQCVCEDYLDWDKFEVRFDEDAENSTNTKCCKKIIINNINNICAVKNAKIIIDYPEGLNDKITLTPVSGWSITNDPLLRQIVITNTQPTQVAPGNEFIVGSVCVDKPSGKNSITATIAIGENSCPISWRGTFECNLNCCAYISQQINLLQTNPDNPDECCYLLTFNVNPDIMNCSQLGKVRIKYNDIIIGLSESDFTPGPNNLKICIHKSYAGILESQESVEIEFLNATGDVICRKTSQLISCYNCCDDIEVNVQPPNECCKEISFANSYCLTTYSLKVFEDGNLICTIAKLGDGQGGFIPIDLNSFTFNCCAVGSSNPGYIVLYDINDMPLCSLQVDFWCKYFKESNDGNPLDSFKKNIIEFEILPNPTYDNTVVYYELNIKSTVVIEIFDIIGDQILVLEEGLKERGKNNVKFNASMFPTGVYIVTLKTQNEVAFSKLIIMK